MQEHLRTYAPKEVIIVSRVANSAADAPEATAEQNPAAYASLAPDLLVHASGAVRVVTMNGPERLNSVNTELHRALSALWDILADDDDAGSAILTGAGRAFCAGGHYPDLLRNHVDPAARRRSVRSAQRLTWSMIECEVPIVAAVNGPAVGLGASLASLCDLVVIAEDAYIADPHVTIGVVAGDGGAATWPFQIGMLRAKELLLLGDRVPARECERLGLANRVVPSADLLVVAMELAQRLAAQPRNALRDTKRALNLHVRTAAATVLDFALAAERESFASDDIRRTIERFGSDKHSTTTPAARSN
jgi:enoyl-CoA hydratase